MVKFLHVRAIDENGDLLPYGGLTVAYSLTPKDIVVRVARCLGDVVKNEHGEEVGPDVFCYKVGRKVAEGRLKKHGPDEVLERKDPVKATIIEYLETKFFKPSIKIDWSNRHKRYTSTFLCVEPVLGYGDEDVVIEPEDNSLEMSIPPDVDGQVKDCRVD